MSESCSLPELALCIAGGRGGDGERDNERGAVI